MNADIQRTTDKPQTCAIMICEMWPKSDMHKHYFRCACGIEGRIAYPDRTLAERDGREHVNG